MEKALPQKQVPSRRDARRRLDFRGVAIFLELVFKEEETHDADAYERVEVDAEVAKLLKGLAKEP